MTERTAGEGETRPEEVAAYIAVLTAEMARMARSHKLPALAYLLEIARMEAIERSGNGPERGNQRIA